MHTTLCDTESHAVASILEPMTYSGAPRESQRAAPIWARTALHLLICLSDERPRAASSVKVCEDACWPRSSELGLSLGDLCFAPLRASAPAFHVVQRAPAASEGCSGTRSGNAATGTGASTAAGARSAGAGCGGEAGGSGAGSGAVSGAEACSTGRDGVGGDHGCGGARGGRAAALGRLHQVSSRLVGAALLLCTPLAAARVLSPAAALLPACPPPARLPPNCQPAASSVPLTGGLRARGPAAASPADGAGAGLVRLWLPVPPPPARNPRNPPPLCTLRWLSRPALSSCNGQMINCASASASQRNMDACACHACLPAREWSKRLRKAHTTRNPACGSAHQHLQR